MCALVVRKMLIFCWLNVTDDSTSTRCSYASEVFFICTDLTCLSGGWTSVVILYQTYARTLWWLLTGNYLYAELNNFRTHMVKYEALTAWVFVMRHTFAFIQREIFVFVAPCTNIEQTDPRSKLGDCRLTVSVIISAPERRWHVRWAVDDICKN